MRKICIRSTGNSSMRMAKTSSIEWAFWCLVDQAGSAVCIEVLFVRHCRLHAAFIEDTSKTLWPTLWSSWVLSLATNCSEDVAFRTIFAIVRKPRHALIEIMMKMSKTSKVETRAPLKWKWIPRPQIKKLSLWILKSPWMRLPKTSTKTLLMKKIRNKKINQVSIKSPSQRIPKRRSPNRKKQPIHQRHRKAMKTRKIVEVEYAS